MEDLHRDGFIQVNGRQGTFVVDHPPHLTCYTLVFPHMPTDTVHWYRFWGALNALAIAMQDSAQLKLPIYYRVLDSGSGTDYENLISDVLAHRVAGLIFASFPTRLRRTPVLE